MAIIRPFRAFRPKPEFASEVAAKPYDVLTSEEARKEAQGHPYSFLHVGKPEIDLDPSVDLYDKRVYAKGKENLEQLVKEKIIIMDSEPCLYLYAQTMDDHTQYGLVGCASVEEYDANVIRKHELTRKDKEEDRCTHVRTTNAQTGPVFLTYRDVPAIDVLVDKFKETPPDNDHVAADDIRHQSWVIRDRKDIAALQDLFKKVPYLYVADGHHRTAAAARVGRERRDANPMHRGDEEYNFFLAVYFPASQLKILDYNRVVKDLNGLSMDQYLAAVGKHFSIREAPPRFKPSARGEFGMYLDKQWRVLRAHEDLTRITDPVLGLDVSILQNYLLEPILGIKDPRTDKRIDFVGGIRGLGELEHRVDSGEMSVAFSLHPTSVNELMAIADAGKLMPPKSTWFEPKLRDGLFTHFLD